MASGYMIRQEQKLRALGERPCPGCGHPNYAHHELQRVTFELNADQTEIIEIPNPGYQPLHFHCDDKACPCVIVHDGKVRQYAVTGTEGTRIANRYPGRCHLCQGFVAAERGTWDRADGVRHPLGHCKKGRRA